MASLELYPEDEQLSLIARVTLNFYLITALVLFLMMMVLGLGMRSAQATWLGLPPDWFYRFLSLHGAGMVGTASLVTTSIMWFFLRKYVQLNLWAFITNYVCFIVGVWCIVLAVLAGGYAGLWTILYPLPVSGMGMWSREAGAIFMLGYLSMGLGQLIFYLDAAAGIIRKYGNFSRALGLHWLFGGEIDQNHPKAVVASAGVLIANVLGLLAGMVALVMSLVNVIYPDIKLNPLLIKNLIYWFGHMYPNATIYMGVIAVYELLPRYTGKPFVLTRAFLWAWLATVLYVILVFPHHLLMDFAQPRWLSIMGQLASWVGGFPVFVVTAYGALVNIYRSGIRWNMPARLLVLSMFGWMAGIIPAILDGTIAVNMVMHNTQWVPGHFHFYMLLGVLSMALAFMFHLIGHRHGQVPPDSAGDRGSFPLYLLGGLIFLFGFLGGGRSSVPRRMAQHLEAWTTSDQIGSVGAALVVLAMLYFVIRIIVALLQPTTQDGDGGHDALADAAR